MLSGLFGFSKAMFGQAEENAEQSQSADAAGDGAGMKIPLEKPTAQTPITASPASTRAPETSPGSTIGSSTPATSKSSPGYRADLAGVPDYEYPSPFVIRNTFVETPVKQLASTVDGSDVRGARSCPASAIGAPLESSDPEDSAAGADGSRVGASPEASPTANAFSQPMLWPRTASGDTLEAMFAGMAAAKPLASAPVEAGDATPSKRITFALASAPEVGRDESPSKRMQKPTYWPRTLSGEDLESTLAALMEASPPGKPSDASPTEDREDALASPPAGPPAQSPTAIRKPQFWPRTMSGDDLDATMAELLETSPPGKAGTPLMKAAETPSSNKVCLSTSPTPKVSGPPSSAPVAPRTAAAATLPPVPTSSPKLRDVETVLPPPPPSEEAPSIEEAELPPPPMAPAAAPDAQVVSILDTLPEAEVGSSERPTIGSWGHNIGKCKPCAFLHTKGCKNGPECPFCHLCDRGEKKRRQRQKWQSQREQELQIQQQQQQQQAHLQQGLLGAAYGMPPLPLAPMAPHLMPQPRWL